jgi:hypothetical protein
MSRGGGTASCRVFLAFFYLDEAWTLTCAYMGYNEAVHRTTTRRMRK